MSTVQIVKLIQHLLNLGLSMTEITKRLCSEYGGYQIPCIEDFDKETRDLEGRTLSRAPVVTITRTETSDEGTFGVLETTGFMCYTGELPWCGNEVKKSCIPVGEYDCYPYSSNKYLNAYEVSKVPGRAAILIHQGNLCGNKDKGFQTNVEGCILLGKSIGKLSGQKAVLQSKQALTEFIHFMNNLPFKLVIREEL